MICFQFSLVIIETLCYTPCEIRITPPHPVPPSIIKMRLTFHPNLMCHPDVFDILENILNIELYLSIFISAMSRNIGSSNVKRIQIPSL